MPHGQLAGTQEIIHMASHTGVGVLCLPLRFIACLLSPAIEVIHGRYYSAAYCTGGVRWPLVTGESYRWKADTPLRHNTVSDRTYDTTGATDTFPFT